VYVATKFENSARAIEVATLLEAAGHTITYKWWTNDQMSADQAAEDVKAVLLAHALVVIAEQDFSYAGTYVEMGIAIGWGIPIYLLGAAMDRCIFTLLPAVHRGIEPLLG
jgi:hypothetical protein